MYKKVFKINALPVPMLAQILGLGFGLSEKGAPLPLGGFRWRAPREVSTPDHPNSTLSGFSAALAPKVEGVSLPVGFAWKVYPAPRAGNPQGWEPPGLGTSRAGNSLDEIPVG